MEKLPPWTVNYVCKRVSTLTINRIPRCAMRHNCAAPICDRKVGMVFDEIRHTGAQAGYCKRIVSAQPCANASRAAPASARHDRVYDDGRGGRAKLCVLWPART